MKKLDAERHYLLEVAELTIDQSAIYNIRVVGHLDDRWSDRLGGLKINPSKGQGEKMITTLQGLLIDQAALIGVLKALYDLRMPLLSVECLKISCDMEVNHEKKT